MRKTIVGALALLATAIASSAAVQNITVNSAGNFLQNGEGTTDGTLSLASNAFYGSFQTGPAKSNNPTANLNFLIGVVENWNTKRNPTLPDVKSPVALDVGSINGNGNPYTTVAGYDYVVFHFGAGQAGGGNDPDETGWWQAWYLGGEAHTFSVPVEGDTIAATSKNDKKKAPKAVGGGLQPVGGFSSARYFNGTPNKVPDSGSTMIALGAGLLGLGGVRRFLIKA